MEMGAGNIWKNYMKPLNEEIQQCTPLSDDVCDDSVNILSHFDIYFYIFMTFMTVMFHLFYVLPVHSREIQVWGHLLC